MSLSIHMLRPGLCALACVALLSKPVASAELQPITTRSDFLALVAGAQLTTLGLSLRISQDGQIRGEGLGSRVRGRWYWKDEFFCRSMVWGERRSNEDCLSVSLISRTLRFTARQGTGASKDFWLRD